MRHEFFFEDKKYISASRASKITGYNSDYIGQLCRKGSLACKMMGRTWFVDETSLINHQVSASASHRGRPIASPKIATPEISNTNPTNDEVDVPTFSATPAFPTEAPISTDLLDNVQNSGLAFRSFHQDALNFIDRGSEKTQNQAFLQKLALTVSVVIFAIIVTPFFIGRGNMVKSLALVAEPAEKIISLENKFTDTVASVGLYRSGVQGSVSYSANALDSVGMMIAEKVNTAIQVVYRGTGNIFKIASKKLRLVFNQGVENQAANVQLGVTVLPASPDTEINERVKQYVRDSFSDETEILPDKSGTSGILKPVFRNKSEDEYVYVVVPINN